MSGDVREPIMWALAVAPTPTAVNGFAAWASSIQRMHPGRELAITSHWANRMVLVDAKVKRCSCMACVEANDEVVFGTDAWLHRSFVVCEFCGNKRCPHAAWHGEECTGSNEPGQPGSDYPAPPAVSVPTEETPNE